MPDSIVSISTIRDRLTSARYTESPKNPVSAEHVDPSTETPSTSAGAAKSKWSALRAVVNLLGRIRAWFGTPELRGQHVASSQTTGIVCLRYRPLLDIEQGDPWAAAEVHSLQGRPLPPTPPELARTSVEDYVDMESYSNVRTADAGAEVEERHYSTIRDGASGSCASRHGLHDPEPMAIVSVLGTIRAISGLQRVAERTYVNDAMFDSLPEHEHTEPPPKPPRTFEYRRGDVATQTLADPAESEGECRPEMRRTVFKDTQRMPAVVVEQLTWRLHALQRTNFLRAERLAEILDMDKEALSLAWERDAPTEGSGLIPKSRYAFRI